MHKQWMSEEDGCDPLRLLLDDGTVSGVDGERKEATQTLNHLIWHHRELMMLSCGSVRLLFGSDRSAAVRCGDGDHRIELIVRRIAPCRTHSLLLVAAHLPAAPAHSPASH